MRKHLKHASAALALTLCASFGTLDAARAETAVNVGLKAADANALDPHLSTKSGDKPIFALIFNGLVRFKPGSMSPAQLEPDLAESWEVSPDGKVWTFKLRKA